MALLIGESAYQSKGTLWRFNVREILIGRGDELPGVATLNNGFDVLDQQNQTTFLDKAD